MKVVIVRPERCVGCLQCRFTCAVAHSLSKTASGAVFESILSKPRISVYPSHSREPFPNKCRHCDPAPCEIACITKAIYRDVTIGAILINPDRCINCGMCAMACPFAAVKYHSYSSGRQAAHKCDQCVSRQKENKAPACVEACKTGALLFDEPNEITDKEAKKLASLVYLGIREKGYEVSPFSSLTDYKQKLNEINGR